MIVVPKVGQGWRVLFLAKQKLYPFSACQINAMGKCNEPYSSSEIALPSADRYWAQSKCDLLCKILGFRSVL